MKIIWTLEFAADDGKKTLYEFTDGVVSAYKALHPDLRPATVLVGGAGFGAIVVGELTRHGLPAKEFEL